MLDENTPDNTAATEALLLEKFEIHREFTKVFLDAFVLLTPKRKVIKFNQAFCTMLGVRAVDVKKAETIDSLIKTQIPGSSKDVVDLVLEATSAQRVDEVQAFRQHDNSFIQLIVSSFPYLDNDGNLVGSCALFRDVTAETNLQGKYQEKAIQSITDPLSGLFTRRYFEEWIDKEMERNKRNNTSPAIGLLMFDLDKFKSVNDTYGHQAGDYVIATTAKILKDYARKSDIIGRYGGEELLVLLVGTTPRGTCVAAEKFRKAIEEHEYIHDGKRIPVTSSIGASYFLSKDDNRVDVVKRADECLYQAKRGGRNVCFCDFDGQQIRAEEFLKNNPEPPSQEKQNPQD